MLDSPFIKEAFALAFREDLALGDVTTRLTVDPSIHANAFLIAKQPLVVCGLPCIPTLIASAGLEITFSSDMQDGDAAHSGDVFGRFAGSARELLAIERTLLNTVQRLCAVATMTKNVTQRLKTLAVLDTRKTAPGFRFLDKYAVSVGGGKNHRACLGDMILIKNNHVDCQPGTTRAERMKCALDKVMAGKPPYMSFEVEVRDFDELAVAVQYKPSVIMLDNFDINVLPRALAAIQKVSETILVEVSGGITPERCIMLEELGVEFVSMGALTHSVESVDVSFKIERL